MAVTGLNQDFNLYRPLEAVGDGARTDFTPPATSFWAERVSDILVTVDGVVQTIVTHYTADLVAPFATPSIRFVAAPAQGANVVVRLKKPAEMTEDITSSAYSPATLTTLTLRVLLLTAVNNYHFSAESGDVAARPRFQIVAALPDLSQAVQAKYWRDNDVVLNNADKHFYFRTGGGAAPAWTQYMRLSAQEIDGGDWTARIYDRFEWVEYSGEVYVALERTAATDVPGASDKWRLMSAAAFSGTPNPEYYDQLVKDIPAPSLVSQSGDRINAGGYTLPVVSKRNSVGGILLGRVFETEYEGTIEVQLTGGVAQAWLRRTGRFTHYLLEADGYVPFSAAAEYHRKDLVINGGNRYVATVDIPAGQAAPIHTNDWGIVGGWAKVANVVSDRTDNRFLAVLTGTHAISMPQFNSFVRLTAASAGALFAERVFPIQFDIMIEPRQAANRANFQVGVDVVGITYDNVGAWYHQKSNNRGEKGDKGDGGARGPAGPAGARPIIISDTANRLVPTDPSYVNPAHYPGGGIFIVEDSRNPPLHITGIGTVRQGDVLNISGIPENPHWTLTDLNVKTPPASEVEISADTNADTAFGATNGIRFYAVNAGTRPAGVTNGVVRTYVDATAVIQELTVVVPTTMGGREYYRFSNDGGASFSDWVAVGAGMSGDKYVVFATSRAFDDDNSTAFAVGDHFRIGTGVGAGLYYVQVAIAEGVDFDDIPAASIQRIDGSGGGTTYNAGTGIDIDADNDISVAQSLRDAVDANSSKRTYPQSEQNKVAANSDKVGLYAVHASALGVWTGVSGNPDDSTVIAAGTTQFDSTDVYLSRTDATGKAVDMSMLPAVNAAINWGGYGGTVSAISENANRIKVTINYTGGAYPLANSGHKFSLFNVADPAVSQHGVYADDETIDGSGDPANRLGVKDDGLTSPKLKMADGQTRTTGEAVVFRANGEFGSAPLGSGGGGNNSVGKAALKFADGTNEGAGRVPALTATDDLTTIDIPSWIIGFPAPPSS